MTFFDNVSATFLEFCYANASVIVGIIGGMILSAIIIIRQKIKEREDQTSNAKAGYNERAHK